jgi:hypothetical protein
MSKANDDLVTDFVNEVLGTIVELQAAIDTNLLTAEEVTATKQVIGRLGQQAEWGREYLQDKRFRTPPRVHAQLVRHSPPGGMKAPPQVTSAKTDSERAHGDIHSVELADVPDEAKEGIGAMVQEQAALTGSIAFAINR